MQLIRPTHEHLASFRDALQRGWSPDTTRPAAAQDTLAKVDDDAAAYLRQLDDPEGLGPPITLGDGHQVPRLPNLVCWMWDDAGFAGAINLRWPKDLGALPPHVLGHLGYTVVEWKRRRGYATQALAQMLPLARQIGLRSVELTTDRSNEVSQRVITANGGVFVEFFDKPAIYGGAPSVRYRIPLAAD